MSIVRWWLVALLMTKVARADDSVIPSVADKRWAVVTGMGVAGLRARTKDAEIPLAAATELGFRFRVLPILELALELGGDVSTDVGFVSIFYDVRYRFQAERPWDPFVLGGVGLAGWFEGRDAFLVHVGGGIERRFRRVGVMAGLELARVGGDSGVVVRDPASELAHFGGWAGAVRASIAYYWGGPDRTRRRFVP